MGKKTYHGGNYVRMIDGYAYYAGLRRNTKKQANADAERIRKKGKNARVIKLKGGYTVYSP